MASKKWQCDKCGNQLLRETPPGVTKCKQGGNCVWKTMGRFIKQLFEF